MMNKAMPGLPKNKIPSRLDPDPSRAKAKPDSSGIETAKMPPPVPASIPPILSSPSVPVPEVNPPLHVSAAPGAFLELGAGYKIRLKKGSGYYLCVSLLARMGHFEECCKLLADKAATARAILGKMMVSRDIIEKQMREDPSWSSHSQKRMSQLVRRAAAGDEKAKGTLHSNDRVVSGKWHGNIREIIGVCCGSYSPKAGNRNKNKFIEAGIVVRSYPEKSRRGNEQVFLMMFPEKHRQRVKSMIKEVYGVDEDAKDK